MKFKIEHKNGFKPFDFIISVDDEITKDTLMAVFNVSHDDLTRGLFIIGKKYSDIDVLKVKNNFIDEVYFALAGEQVWKTSRL